MSVNNPIPDFVVIGSMRSGTTTLHEMLSEVDGLCLARMKETDFFIAEKNYDRGAEWYKKQFDNPKAICGEVSPNYTKRDVFPGVPKRVYKANPKAKIIYIVRDPVARAISQYKFTYLFGREMPLPQDFMTSHEGQHILSTSRYAWQIEPWIATFGKESILFIDFKALCENPDKELEKICRFIGLKTIIKNQNAGHENSLESLEFAPKWYLQLRETRMGNSLRAAMPKNMARFIKKTISGKGIKRSAPAIPEGVQENMKSFLAGDAREFIKISGMSFPDWDL